MVAELLTDSENLPSAVAAAAVDAGLPNSSLSKFLSAFLAKDENLLTSINGVTREVLIACTNAVKSASAASFRNVWFVNMAFGLLAALRKLNEICLLSNQLIVSTPVSLFLLPVKGRMTNHIESALEPGKQRDAQFQISTDVANKAVTDV